MPKAISKFIVVFTLGLIVVNCANRGRPGGGPKDILPPKIVRETPANYSTNFNGDEIRIYFDEYIKIKNIQRQLIISPPMETPPVVTPLGSASKYIKIKILDTLAPNTTYAFNFGNSIEDNNESNPFTYYKYVFSTGDYIDSLKVEGRIFDAINRKPDDFVSVMLYENDSTYTDSLVYKKVPRYITNTLDSLTTFTIENVKPGSYKLLAIKDNNQDNKFQQKSDKIAFYEGFINVPTDSTYNLKLFQEELDFNVKKPRLIAGEKIAFGYEGDYKNMRIKLLSKTVPNNFKSRITKDPKADSLWYWYTPKLKDIDTLEFNVTNGDYIKDFNVRIKDNKRDTLTVAQVSEGNLGLSEDFKITANIPFERFNKSLFTILDKDSTAVNYQAKLDTLTNEYAFSFTKTENNKYNIQALPEAFTDFFGNTNDTLSYRVNTKSEMQYSNVRVLLRNATYPVIVQLTNSNDEVEYEMVATKEQIFDFININPGKYFLRVIHDSNGNAKWDTGNYLKHQEPERVSYAVGEIDARAGFDSEEEFTLD